MKHLLVITLALISTSLFASFERKHGFLRADLSAVKGSSDTFNGNNLYGNLVPALGIRMGAQIHKNFNVAGGIEAHQDSDTILGIKVKASFFSVLGEFNYTLDGYNGFYIGPRLGFMSGKAEGVVGATTVTNKDTGILYGIGMGYNFPIGERLSIGVKTDYSATKLDQNNFSFFSLGVSGSFLF